MTAVLEEAPIATAQEAEDYSSETKDALLQQLQERNKDAVPKQETDEVHVREDAKVGEQVGEGSEEGEQEERGVEANDSEQEEKRPSFQFALGEENWDVDPDAVFEFKADGKNISMTLSEMRDAAAGGVAIRNRMRNLAEERKKLYAPYKNFNSVSSKDPLGALKKVFAAIKQVEPEADLNAFLVGLGKQAQSLTEMSAPERKAYELEKELDETRETLTETEKAAIVQERKSDLIEGMGLTEEQVFEYGQSLLADPDLSKTIRNEEDLFDRIEYLADEVHAQHAVYTALQKHDPNLPNNDPLVFELSKILRNNPDFDEHDLEEIAQGVMTGIKKSNASRVLSRRQRSNVSKGYAKKKQDLSNLTPRDSLMQQILDKKNSKK